MPSTSTLNDDDKAKVKSAVPPPTNKIFFAASASVYFTHPEPNEWSCAGLQGALVFSQNTKDKSFHFQMVDLDGTSGVIWDHELCEGNTCMIGFMYSDEVEAKTLHKKVKTKRNKDSPKPQSEKKKLSKGGKIDSSMISAPKAGSFIHVAHMGYDANSGFTSKGVDPSWAALLGNLEKTIPREVIERDMEFIKGFVSGYQAQQQPAAKGAKKPKPSPPPKRPHGNGGSISSPITSATHAPQAPSRSNSRYPPPPPRPPVPASPLRYVPPPAPPPVAQQSSQTPAPPHSPGQPAPPPADPPSGSASAPPAPPYPSTTTPKPPLPPDRLAVQDYNGGSAAPPPPPIPAPVPSSTGAPPSPHSPSPPPSVAPPSVQSILPPAKPGRDDLLASIQAWRLNVSSVVGDGQETGGGDDVDDGDDWDNVDEDEDEDWEVVKEAVAGPSGSR